MLPGPGKMHVPVERANSFFLHHFVLFRPTTDGMMLLSIGEGNLLYQLSIQMLISFRKAHTHTLRDNVLPAIWTSLPLLKLAHTINHQGLPLQVFTIVEVIILSENAQVEPLQTRELQRLDNIPSKQLLLMFLENSPVYGATLQHQQCTLWPRNKNETRNKAILPSG